MVNDQIFRSFLRKYVRKQDLDEDEDIFASGYVDSMFAMQLVLFIENTFMVKVEAEDLDFKNFRSIRSLCEFVDAKLESMPHDSATSG